MTNFKIKMNNIKRLKCFDYFYVKEFFSSQDEELRKKFQIEKLKRWYYFIPAVLINKLKCWGYFDNNKLVGIVLTHAGLNNRIDMSFGILKDFRGQGIGQKLFEVASKEKGTYYLTYDKDNLGAVGLYNKLGFTIIGEVLKAEFKRK